MKISRQFYEQDAGKVQTKNSLNLDDYSHFTNVLEAAFLQVAFF